MGVSAAQGSAGLKQGVCTSTTRPSNPYEGQMIYETDTDLTYIWGGTAWQQVSGGTAVGNSGLVYITSVAATGASTTISNCFTSTYENYRIIFSNGATSNTGVYFYIQWTVAGTPSTTSYGWSYTGLREDNVSSPYIGYSSAVPRTNLGELGMNPTFAGAVNNSSIDVYMPFLTARTFALFQSVSYPSPFAFVSGGIAQDQSTSKDGFKLGISAGTYTGTITVYGYRKA